MKRAITLLSGKEPKTDHFDKWYGVKAHWHKIPQYLALGMLLLWLMGKV